MEVSSIDSHRTYVAGGFGIGVRCRCPKRSSCPNVRVVPLPASPPSSSASCGRENSALLQAFLDEFQLRAKRFPQLTAKET